MNSLIFILALFAAFSSSFGDSGEGYKARVRTFTSQERPATASDHGESVPADFSGERRTVRDSETEFQPHKEGHPFGESLVFPQGYRQRVTNW
ncbi:MAG: hypothetical protein ACKN9V_01810 [Pseudomonadota bacterium]